MTARPNRVAAVALCAAVACCSCQRKKPPAPVMVPPAITVRVPEKPPAPPPPPPELPPGQSGPAVTPPPAVSETKMPGPPRRKRQAAKTPRKPDTSVTQSAEAPAAQEAAPAPVPQLGQMLSDAQRREYEARIHDALERARANLRKARNNPRLTEAQQRMAAQVDTFVDQAEERRKTDLVSSRSLAERADLLARDLVESLR